MDSNVSFATCDLRLDTDDERYGNLCAEISLQNNTANLWEVQVNIFSKPIETDSQRE